MVKSKDSDENMTIGGIPYREEESFKRIRGEKVIMVDEAVKVTKETHRAIINHACKKMKDLLTSYGITVEEFVEWYKRNMK